MSENQMSNLQQYTMKVWILICSTIFFLSTDVSATYGKVERWQKCNFTICYDCYANQAHCYTNSSMSTVPQDMVETLTYLDIKYKASNKTGGCLYQTDVQRYHSLESIHLYGDFSCIDSSALANLSNLTWLHLEKTQIHVLPDGLLKHNRKFTWLQLFHNHLKEIPFNIFTKNGAKSVTQFIFHGHRNASLPCSNNTLHLPPEFYWFDELAYLDLGYNIFSNESCSSEMSDSFFDSVSNVTRLSVEGTHFLYGKETALNGLKELIYIDISFLYYYRKCPANAGALFDNIPGTVTNLTVTHWETGVDLDKECFITNQSVLMGLSKLKLRNLNFGYSDGIFGPTLMKSTIPGSDTLTDLDLSFCRLYSIERDVFSYYPNLKALNLAGNALGPNNIDFVSQKLSGLHFLSLQSTMIRSDEYLYYDAVNLICDFPNLHTVDFSSNNLRRFPDFKRSITCNVTTSEKVERVFATECKIEEFMQRNSSDQFNICLRFPNLKQINMDGNVLRNLYGLEKCVWLEHLNVYQNHLYYDYHDTDVLANILMQLRHLQWIDLGFNAFHTINSSVLYNMPNLTKFYISKNYIQSLDRYFFSRNPKLRIIDLSSNHLQYLHHELFKNLPLLERLYLRENLISELTKDFLHVLDAYGNLGFFSLGNNPYDCGCNKTYFQTWLSNHPYLIGSMVDFIKCDSPPYVKGRRVIDYKNDLYKCTIKGMLIVSGCLLAGAFVTLVIALPCYKYRWYVIHIKLVWSAFRGSMNFIKMDHKCPFDAFISYDPRCEEDCLWVANELLGAIEDGGKSGLKLYLEHRDALSGTHRYTEREIALTKSKRILIVVSNSYLKSADCLNEADLSGLQMHGTEFYQPNRVMLLIREDLNEEIIRPPMSSLLLGKTLEVEYDPRRKPMMWRKIKKFLSKPLYTYNKKERSLTESSNSYGSESVGNSTEYTPLLQ